MILPSIIKTVFTITDMLRALSDVSYAAMKTPAKERPMIMITYATNNYR